MTKRQVLGLVLAALVSTPPSGCGGAKEQTTEQFQTGLDAAAEAAERGERLRRGEGGLPPVPDPENAG